MRNNTAELTVFSDGEIKRIQFEGTPLLREVLSHSGLYQPQPCGGRGVCGKCSVEVKGAVSEANESEKKAGQRLACQVRLLGDCEVRLSHGEKSFRIEESAESMIVPGTPMPGRCGAAADIGTTTLVLRLYSLADGHLLGTQSMPNPQRMIAADVMGRISAALNGQLEDLKTEIADALFSMLSKVCAAAGIDRAEVSSLVLTGNTTMLYLLTGRDPTCLSRAPFEMDESFGKYTELFGCNVYLPGCMHAFVGADITCALLATGLCDRERTALLCDIGTNGEIALWKSGKLLVTSTAAGPAFEGAGISCGCGSIDGAIDRVWIDNNQIEIRTVGEKKAAGLCGSGLIDAVAAFLELGDIDETGACEKDTLELAPGVSLLPKDIRAFQLAKAAVAAGIKTLLEVSGTKEEEIGEFLIAGGFGSHLDLNSAARTGLIPESLKNRARSVGNAALAGASMLLLDVEKIRRSEEIATLAQHISLGGDSKFNAHYIDCMMFPE